MKEITDRLTAQGLDIAEGSASPEQQAHLTAVAQQVGARMIGEIGFNAGYSSYALLASSPEVQVVSFDIGIHPYVMAAKEFIDEKFPDRHTLIIGDSRRTVPEYKGAEFDLTFIDGGHRYGVARADLLNMRTRCSSMATIVMDDLIPWKSWGIGPTLAWRNARRKGVVVQDGLYQDGLEVARARWPGDRIWGVGHYTPAVD